MLFNGGGGGKKKKYSVNYGNIFNSESKANWIVILLIFMTISFQFWSWTATWYELIESEIKIQE